MQVKVTRIFDIVVIRLDGQFKDEVELEAVASPPPAQENAKILINFERVEYINSSCFRSLARLHQAVTANGGDVRLCSLKQNVRQLFTIANLDRGYHIYSCEDEGIISFYNNLPSGVGFPMEITYSG